MAKKIHYTKEMKECPYCGNDEFYIKQAYSGTCNYYMRFDMKNEKAENGEMYQSATHKDLTKYAYCSDCNKRLFLIDEYYNALFD
ncbi:MAG: hypothetical protein IJN92_09470 [Lachnospiraceae bacterium]|nr:hypothetical protein [Lachnospiraceae bacterium]